MRNMNQTSASDDELDVEPPNDENDALNGPENGKNFVSVDSLCDELRTNRGIEKARRGNARLTN